MAKKFTCPEAFNLKQATTFIISKNYVEEIIHINNNTSILYLNEEAPKYFRAQEKLWQECHFPNELVFEQVDCKSGRENKIKHFHTEFDFRDHVIHIDYVIAWSYGPYTIQHCVKIFVDQQLKVVALNGGISLGASWERGWPATLAMKEFFMRFEGRFKTENQKMHFKASDRDFPMTFGVWIKEHELPFKEKLN